MDVTDIIHEGLTLSFKPNVQNIYLHTDVYQTHSYILYIQSTVIVPTLKCSILNVNYQPLPYLSSCFGVIHSGVMFKPFCHLQPIINYGSLMKRIV